MGRRRLWNGLLAAIIVTALAWLYGYLHPRPPKMDLRAHQVLGEVLAREALKALQPGGRLILIARDPEPFQVPAAVAQLQGFARALRPSGTRVATLHSVKLDPLRVVGVPPGDFVELIRRSRPEDVIVSFLGPPVLSAEQLSRVGNSHPRVLAVCSGSMPSRVDLRGIFDQQLLVGAVVSRRQSTPGRAAQDFEHQFRLLTSADLADWPTLTAANE
jgi:hypothetical protein